MPTKNNVVVSSSLRHAEPLKALCALVASGSAEDLPGQLVNTVCKALRATITRLYGLEEISSARLVLLASASEGGVTDCMLVPGWSVEAPAAAGLAGGTLGNDKMLASTDNVPQQLLLLQRAVASMTPVSYLIDGDSLASETPSDCASDLVSHGSKAFAALPLAVGGRLIGVLWISSPGPELSDTAALLTDPNSLQQIGLAATLALSTAAARSMSPTAGHASHYTSWLAGCLRRLADSSTLHSLVWELGESLAQHVRTRFLLDATVTAALLPERGARTAFMLHAGAPQPTAGGRRPSSMLDMTGTSCRPLLRVPIDGVGAEGHKPRSLMFRAPAAESSPLGHRGHGSPKSRQAAPKSSAIERLEWPQHHKLPVCSASQAYISKRNPEPPIVTCSGSGGNTPIKCGTNPPVRQSSRVFHLPKTNEAALLLTGGMLAGDSLLEDGGANPVSGSLLVATAVPSLHAKPFEASHTLLQRMASGVGGLNSTAGMLCGPAVDDCARWVQDVQRPSRDVYLLLAGAGSWTVNGGSMSSNPGAIRSLALVGLEAGEGAVLGLYLAFTTQLPPRLLEAVQASCAALLGEALAPTVRFKLCGELATELSTLCVGVPGSYGVVPAPSSVPTTSLAHGSNGSDAGFMPAGASVSVMIEVLQRGRLARTTTNVSSVCQLEMLDAQSGSGYLLPPDGQYTAVGTAQLNAFNTAASGSTANTTQEGRLTAGALDLAGDMTHMGQDLMLDSLPRYMKQRTVDMGRVGGHSPQLQQQQHHHQLFQQATTRTAGHYASGPTSRAGMGSLSVEAAGALGVQDAVAAGTGALSAVLAVHPADTQSSMRAHMGLLVDAIMGTLRYSSSTAALASEETRRMNAATLGSTATSVSRVDLPAPEDDDLEDLQLYDILGEGASGVVLRGLLGANMVAVKLMEVPDPDSEPSEGGGSGGVGEEAVQKMRLEGQRAMLRNAMELAVLRSVSHVNIVQCHGVHNNVQLAKVAALDGMPASCFLRRCHPGQADTPASVDAGESPICTAIVTELCDCGTLADVLMARTFPRLLVHKAGVAAPAASSGVMGAGETPPAKFRIDMNGVYLTLLEIALALRHLHARRLVHRDLKPANILLKSSPGDPRGWTCKLADFGFTLVLDQQSSMESAEAVSGSHHLVATSPRGATTPPLSGGIHNGRTVRRIINVEGESASGRSGTAALMNAGWFTVQDAACGTVTHMAPEAMRKNHRIDASVDVFAFGVIMWELFCGRGHRPYAKLHPDAIPRAVIGGLRPIFPDSTPEAFRRLAQQCWAAEPHLRPRAADLVVATKTLLAQHAIQRNQRQQQQQARGG